MMRRCRALELCSLSLLAMLVVACASAGGTTSDLDGGTLVAHDGGSAAVDGGAAADGGPVAGGPCVNVADCPRGFGCLTGHCVNAGLYECRNDLAPIVQVEPATLDFGSIRVGDPVTKTLRIRNIGSCNLQISEVSIAPGASTDFSCEECRPRGTYPVTLVPFDSKTIVVAYTASDATPDLASLNVVTTDPTFPLIQVPMKSSTKDAPRIFVEPAVLDFGYVPVGQRRTLTFNITNAGGQTPLLVRAIENLPLASPNYLIATTATAVDGGLAYLNSGTPPVPMTVSITYQPTTLATHNEAIRITSTDALTPRVDVQVKGFSVTPPNVRVTPQLVNFGTVAVGTRQQIPITIENNGGADLQVQLAFAALSSTSFSYNPTGLAAIPGGQRATLYIEYLPTTLGAAPTSGFHDGCCAMCTTQRAAATST